MKKNFRILKFKNDRPIFEVKNISKSFNGRSILKKISLKVYPGELVSLFGPNGAGKSTLFNIAIGAENADSGEIFINKKTNFRNSHSSKNKAGFRIFASD